GPAAARAARAAGRPGADPAVRRFREAAHRRGHRLLSARWNGERTAHRPRRRRRRPDGHPARNAHGDPRLRPRHRGRHRHRHQGPPNRPMVPDAEPSPQLGQADGYDHAPLIVRLVLALVTACLAWGVSQAAAGPGQPALGARLGAALHAAGIGPQRTGAVALDLATGKAVFAHNAAVGFVPASNEKLPVTYAALKLLGPSFRFPTEIRGQGSLGTDGTWSGNLVLKGYGDPTLSSWNLRQLVSKIRETGITHVTGMVIGDESFFDKQRTAPGWKASFYIEESPPLSALVVDRAWTGKRYTTTP